MKNAIMQTIEAWHPEFRAIRRKLHANPELAYQEFATAQTVAELLQSWGIEISQGLGGTGVVATIHGERPGATVGLRADLDALPMPEKNDFAHASRNPGVMHACGHDGHTTMLLAAARYLAENRGFAGTVVLIFQPAEEGGAGAASMIKDGLFEQHPVDAVFGLHNWPGMAAGSFGLTTGAIMASSNRFAIDIQGRGGHAAMPNLVADPVLAGAQLVVALQSLVAREIDPLEPAVISVTQFHGGSADNVIPEQVQLRGTVRTLSNSLIDQIEQRMGAVASGVCQALGCSAELQFTREYPPTLNHPKETALCARVMHELVGEPNTNTAVKPSMGAEDFAFMLQERPGCYVWLGNGDGAHRELGHGLGPCTLHNGSYDFNDGLITLGASYWVLLALRFLDERAA